MALNMDARLEEVVNELIMDDNPQLFGRRVYWTRNSTISDGTVQELTQNPKQDGNGHTYTVNLRKVRIPIKALMELQLGRREMLSEHAMAWSLQFHFAFAEAYMHHIVKIDTDEQTIRMWDSDFMTFRAALSRVGEQDGFKEAMRARMKYQYLFFPMKIDDVWSIAVVHNYQSPDDPQDGVYDTVGQVAMVDAFRNGASRSRKRRLVWQVIELLRWGDYNIKRWSARRIIMPTSNYFGGHWETGFQVYEATKVLLSRITALHSEEAMGYQEALWNRLWYDFHPDKTRIEMTGIMAWWVNHRMDYLTRTGNVAVKNKLRGIEMTHSVDELWAMESSDYYRFKTPQVEIDTLTEYGNWWHDEELVEEIREGAERIIAARGDAGPEYDDELGDELMGIRGGGPKYPKISLPTGELLLAKPGRAESAKKPAAEPRRKPPSRAAKKTTTGLMDESTDLQPMIPGKARDRPKKRTRKDDDDDEPKGERGLKKRARKDDDEPLEGEEEVDERAMSRLFKEIGERYRATLSDDVLKKYEKFMRAEREAQEELEAGRKEAEEKARAEEEEKRKKKEEEEEENTGLRPNGSIDDMPSVGLGTIVLREMLRLEKLGELENVGVKSKKTAPGDEEDDTEFDMLLGEMDDRLHEMDVEVVDVDMEVDDKGDDDMEVDDEVEGEKKKFKSILDDEIDELF